MKKKEDLFAELKRDLEKPQKKNKDDKILRICIYDKKGKTLGTWVPKTVISSTKMDSISFMYYNERGLRCTKFLSTKP